MTKIEYYSKYVWYGYEGGGTRNCEYSSRNINNAIRFINICEKIKVKNFDWDNEDDVNEYDEIFSHRPNGFIKSFECKIHKRTIIEEVVDLKSELRNEKIENVLKTN